MPSVVAQLRALVPRRPLSWAEGMRIGDLQASRLLALSGVTGGPVPEEIISGLPRVSVEREFPFKVSGTSAWAQGTWMIGLNGGEPATRQRFSLAHEFKHVLDHPFEAFLYPSQLGFSPTERAEAVADRFAANLLMPRPWVKRAWCAGVQDIAMLARMFEVSPAAMRVRLTALGLLAPTRRCAVAA